jgi:adenylosuccinate synthase
VTSSQTAAGGMCSGSGLAPRDIGDVVGVVKAYTTRVGNGPLPTELEEPMASRVRDLGHEFGATTGRPRRCGWFDALVVRYAARINGLSDLAVTKLDVLDTLERVGICTGYRVGDDVHEEFPGDVTTLESVEPVYEWFEGWRRPTGEARALAQLPPQARRYLDRIEQLVEAPITFVSVGTRRDQIIGLD